MTCTTCGRDPERVNSAWAECSHPDCPHRRRAWSERPGPELHGDREPDAVKQVRSRAEQMRDWRAAKKAEVVA